MFNDYDFVAEYKHECGRKSTVLKRTKRNMDFDGGQYLVRFFYDENQKEMKVFWTEKAAKEGALDWCIRDTLPCGRFAHAT